MNLFTIERKNIFHERKEKFSKFWSGEGDLDSCSISCFILHLVDKLSMGPYITCHEGHEVVIIDVFLIVSVPNAYKMIRQLFVSVSNAC